MPLLEREWVLETLDTLVADAAGGNGSIVFLSGEAGAGKTTVVRALLDRLPEDAVALVGACDSMPAPAQLWPLRDLAERAGPALREPVHTNGTREALFRGTLTELSSRPGATVLVVEDVHWADDATLDLLRFLGRRVQATRGVVIVTYRDDSSSELKRLRLVLGDLATAPAAHRVRLEPLSRATVGLLARGRTADIETLYARTGGNAFFVTEMLTSGNRLPDTVSDAIAARYARLSPPARRALELAAVMGDSVELATLQAVAGVDNDALADTIESGALQFDNRTLHFRHALVRDAVLSAIPPLQRSERFRTVFEAFDARPADVEPATMAYLAEQAGRYDAVSAYANAAAQRAAALRSYREAALQYQRAIRYSSDWALPDRSELVGQLASTTYYCGSGETDIEVLREVAAACRLAGDIPRLADHLISLAWLLNDEGMLQESEQCAQEAVTLADELGDPAIRAAALCALADIFFQAGKSDQSLEMDIVALELALQTGRSRTAIHAAITMGSTLLDLDRPRGIELLEQCVMDAERHHFDGEAAHAMGILGYHFTDVYELDRGERVLQQMAASTAEHDLDCWWRWATIGLSRNALNRGDWSAAAAYAAAALAVQSGCFLNRLYAHVTIARLRARRADPEVEQALSDADESRGIASFPAIDGAIAIARAEAAYLAGDHDRALEEAMRALSPAIAYQMPWLAGQFAHIVLALGGNLPADYEPVGPYRAECAGEWQEAHAAWTELGAPYEAACAQAMRSDEIALRDALAAFDRLGARDMSDRVARRLRELGFASIPRGPRGSTRANAFGLTAREAEVLEQLGEGGTNSEIAARLFLSERTV